MPAHTNFYENLKEAQMRLRNTVVMYDGEPYYILAITNHKNDGIFRIYMDPVGAEGGMNAFKDGPARPPFDKYLPETPDLGIAMDAWMEKYPKSGLQRKQMNSPKFNKFRPFPMGMVNIQGHTNFVERHPQRKVEQGLTRAHVFEKPVGVGTPLRVKTDLNSPEFRACLLGQYPHHKECIERMLDPTVANTAVGFDRNFAIWRGPLNSLFLAYKTDVVGFLPEDNFKKVRLAKDFIHTKEAVGDLGVFTDIVT